MSISGCSPTTNGWRAAATANTSRSKNAPSGPTRPSLRISPLICLAPARSSAPAPMLRRCEAAMQQAVGAQATAVRSQTYYLDVTPPGHDKGTFVQTMAKRLGISTDAVATIGDMQNDLAMFQQSGLSIAMGNATDDVKKMATHVTTSNAEEGFARAIELILKG